MKVKDCMCDEICVAKPNFPIYDCAKLMKDNHTGCIPVCDDQNKVVGIVTDRDIILRAIACDKNPKTTPVSDIMSCNVCSCNENDDIKTAEEKMKSFQVRRLPVLENEKIVGILTIGDLVENEDISTQGVCGVLEDVCKCYDNSKNAE